MNKKEFNKLKKSLRLFYKAMSKATPQQTHKIEAEVLKTCNFEWAEINYKLKKYEK